MSILSTLDSLAEQLLKTFATRLYAFNSVTWDRIRSSGGTDPALFVATGTASEVHDGVTGTLVKPIDTMGDSQWGHVVYSLLFSGASWNRQRNNYEVTVLASAARTIAINSADLVNYNARGVIVVINVTAITATPILTVTITGKDTLSGKYVTILASAAISTVSVNTLIVYPGIAAAANSKADQPLPRVWRVEVAVADADSATYSIGANYIN